jgi:formate dehydrogenase gamma subunit
MSERQMHWAVAVPFMVCYVTAVVLIAVYNLHPQRPLRAVVSWTHRLSGLCLFVLPAWTIVRHWYDVAVHLRNIGEVWRWTLADVKWLAVMGPAQLSKKIILPEQGKFNAAEKINFMVLTATVPLYLCTGLMIWSHQFAFPAWIVHFVLASAATPLLLGHVFMATVYPDTRVGLSGMITGFVDRRWASHHYGRWYRENFAAPTTPHATGVEAGFIEEGAVSTPAPSDLSAHPAPWESSASWLSSGAMQDEPLHREADVSVLPAPVAATHGTGWTGQFEPVMASGHASGRTSTSSGTWAAGAEDWEHEPLPPFMRPAHGFDRTRARWPPIAGSDAVIRSDPEKT